MPAEEIPAEEVTPVADDLAHEPVEGADEPHEFVEAYDEAADVEDDEDESVTEATLIEPRAGPEAEQRAYDEALLEEQTDAAQPAERGEWAPQSQSERHPEPELAGDEEFSPFVMASDDEPRGRRPLMTLLVVALIIVALAALFWFAAPDSWKTRVGLSAGGASPLALVTTHMDRQRLESGNELLTVTGRVINPTGQEQPVPPLACAIEVGDRQGRLQLDDRAAGAKPAARRKRQLQQRRGQCAARRGRDHAHPRSAEGLGQAIRIQTDLAPAGAIARSWSLC